MPAALVMRAMSPGRMSGVLTFQQPGPAWLTWTTPLTSGWTPVALATDTPFRRTSTVTGPSPAYPSPWTLSRAGKAVTTWRARGGSFAITAVTAGWDARPERLAAESPASPLPL